MDRGRLKLGDGMVDKATMEATGAMEGTDMGMEPIGTMDIDDYSLILLHLADITSNFEGAHQSANSQISKSKIAFD